MTLQRRPQGGFRAQWDGKDIAARTVLLATGLVDESPKVEGLGSAVYDGAVRFCPICDGFEAMYRRIGVLGSADEAGRKALCLRTLHALRDHLQHSNGGECVRHIALFDLAFLAQSCDPTHHPHEHRRSATIEAPTAAPRTPGKLDSFSIACGHRQKNRSRRLLPDLTTFRQ
jgi:hypothetical protein